MLVADNAPSAAPRLNEVCLDLVALLCRCGFTEHLFVQREECMFSCPFGWEHRVLSRASAQLLRQAYLNQPRWEQCPLPPFASYFYSCSAWSRAVQLFVVGTTCGPNWVCLPLKRYISIRITWLRSVTFLIQNAKRFHSLSDFTNVGEDNLGAFWKQFHVRIGICKLKAGFVASDAERCTRSTLTRDRDTSSRLACCTVSPNRPQVLRLHVLTTL